MKVLNARIDWHQGWANDPTLEILVNEIPSHDSLVYRVDNECFFAETADGYVSFFVHNPENEFGYGGRVFHVATNKGPMDVKGPWSSRSGAMNLHGFPGSMECSITDDPQAFARGHTFFAGHIRDWLGRQIIAMFLPDVELREEIHFGDEPYYIPRPKGGGDKPGEV